MVEVIVRYQAGTLTTFSSEDFSKVLRKVIIKVLSTSSFEKELQPKDIMIRYQEHHPFDVGTMEREIEITFNDTPLSRRKLRVWGKLILEKLEQARISKNPTPRTPKNKVLIKLMPMYFLYY